MSDSILTSGLLAGGLAGFLAGARPRQVLGLFRRGGRVATEAEAAAYVEYLYPLAAAFFAGFVFSTLVPEALSRSPATVAAFAAGIAAMWVLAKFVFKADPCCEIGHQHRGLSLVSLAAMSICSLNDGLIIGLLQPAWYSGLNLGMVLHKATSSFAVAQMMSGSRYRGAALAALGTGYVAISPAAQIAVGFPAFSRLRDSEVPAAFGAGLLAYVTVSSLIPHAGGILRRRPRAAYGFAAALLISVSLGVWHQVLHGRGAAVPRAATAAEMHP